MSKNVFWAIFPMSTFGTLLREHVHTNIMVNSVKKMCLWLKTFGSIRQTVRKFMRDEKKRKLSIGSMNSILLFLVEMVKIKFQIKMTLKVVMKQMS